MRTAIIFATNHWLFHSDVSNGLLLCYSLVPAVPPTVTFFTATPDLCGFTTALTCEANTNGTSPTGTTLHITRLNDGMDLSGDPRFMEFRSSTPPNILHVEYSFPQRLSDNGDYMCVVNNTAGTSVESVTLTSGE